MFNRSTPASGPFATVHRIGIVLLAAVLVVSMVGTFPVAAAAPDECTTETTSTVPVDVVFVIDTSGSMSGSRMAEAKTATKTAVDALPDNAQVSVVDFDSSATVVQSLTTDHASATTAVDGLSAGGLTYMDAGIQAALDELTGPHARPEATKVVVVLGDGAVNSNSLTLADAGKRDHDIRFISISVGTSSNVPNLQYIAGTTPDTADAEGDYYPSPDEAELTSVFRNIVSSITETVCEDDGDDGDREGPRFEVTNVTWSTQTPTVGEEVSVTFTVENVGDDDGWFKGNVHSDHTPVDRQVAKLDPDESHEFTVNVTWDGRGDHRLFVRTHYLGEVTVLADDG